MSFREFLIAKENKNFSSIKLFLLDIGLLGAMSELDMESVMYGNSAFSEFKGSLTEQYVLQQLVSDTKYMPCYNSGEKSVYVIDFLIQKGMENIPLWSHMGIAVTIVSIK